MGDQVTLVTLQRLLGPERLYLETLDEGRLYGAPRHGHPDRWDWSVTLRTLTEAQDKERRAEQLVAAMTPEQRAMLWLDGHPEREVLRRVARRMA